MTYHRLSTAAACVDTPSGNPQPIHGETTNDSPHAARTTAKTMPQNLFTVPILPAHGRVSALNRCLRSGIRENSAYGRRDSLSRPRNSHEFRSEPAFQSIWTPSFFLMAGHDSAFTKSP